MESLSVRLQASLTEFGPSWFLIAGIDPMDPGCWQASAGYKGAELTYVYEISTPEPTLDS